MSAPKSGFAATRWTVVAQAKGTKPHAPSLDRTSNLSDDAAHDDGLRPYGGGGWEAEVFRKLPPNHGFAATHLYASADR